MPPTAPYISSEQIQAAQTEVREMLAAALPGRTPQKPSQWTVQFVDSLFGLPRCRHLHARPVQPHLLTIWDRQWRCRPCTTRIEERRHQERIEGRYTGLGVIEEGTCDGCRTYRGPTNLTPTVIRIDLWTVVCALCPACEHRAANDP